MRKKLCFNHNKVFCFFVRKSMKNFLFLEFASYLLKYKKFFYFVISESYFLKYKKFFRATVPEAFEISVSWSIKNFYRISASRNVRKAFL